MHLKLDFRPVKIITDHVIFNSPYKYWPAERGPSHRNLVSFRTFRGSLFLQPFSWLGLSCQMWQGRIWTPALDHCIVLINKLRLQISMKNTNWPLNKFWYDLYNYTTVLGQKPRLPWATSILSMEFWIFTSCKNPLFFFQNSEWRLQALFNFNISALQIYPL